MNKKASLLGWAGTFAAAEATAQTLSHLARDRSSNLFGAGVELGSKGEKIHPYKETISKNLFGRKQLNPYEAGLGVGKRMQEMDPDRQERFLNKVVGMGSARKDRLELETGKKVKDPILNALEGYQMGKDRKHGLFQSILTKGSVPAESSSTLANLAANATTVPTGVVDSRFALRPAIRAVETQPKMMNLQKRWFPEGTKRHKLFNTARDYID